MVAKPNTSPIRVIEETPGYWRAIFDYPPFNVVDGDVFQALQDLDAVRRILTRRGHRTGCPLFVRSLQISTSGKCLRVSPRKGSEAR